jgi:hypothetical protein
MAGLEIEVEDVGAERVMRWRLEELEHAGYGHAAARAADREIDLHFAIDLLRHGCPPTLAVRVFH